MKITTIGPFSIDWTKWEEYYNPKYHKYKYKQITKKGI